MEGQGMRSACIDEEINELDSYTSFVTSWERHKDNVVEIVTLEGEHLVCEINDNGWSTNQREFPTLEALLDFNSPKFVEKWNAELYRRLENLEKAS